MVTATQTGIYTIRELLQDPEPVFQALEPFLADVPADTKSRAQRGSELRGPLGHLGSLIEEDPKVANFQITDLELQRLVRVVFVNFCKKIDPDILVQELSFNIIIEIYGVVCAALLTTTWSKLEERFLEPLRSQLRTKYLGFLAKHPSMCQDGELVVTFEHNHCSSISYELVEMLQAMAR